MIKPLMILREFKLASGRTSNNPKETQIDQQS